MRTSAWAGIIIVALIVIGGIWYYVSSNSSSSYNANTESSQIASSTMATSSNEMASSTTATSTSSAAPMSATVTFDGNTFSPSTVTIAQGGTVNFVDTASSPFWVATDPHPEHTGYDGTTRQVHCASDYTGPAPFDECSSGMSYSFTFAKVGSWGYHDHLEAQIKGTVVVVAQ